MHPAPQIVSSPPRPPSPLPPFIDGAGYPFRALGLLLRRSDLWPYLAWPVLINLVLFIGLTAGVLLPGFGWIDSLFADPPAWLALLESLLQVVFALLVLAINALLIATLGVALGAPWYGAMSLAVENSVTGVPSAEIPLSAATVLRDLGRAVGFVLKRLGLAAVLFLLVLPLNLIPLVGSVLAITANLLTAAMLLALDFLDPALERRLLSFRGKLDYLRRHPGLCLGFGLVMLPLCSVPLLNLFCVPLAVVGATLMYCERMGVTASSPPP